MKTTDTIMPNTINFRYCFSLFAITKYINIEKTMDSINARDNPARPVKANKKNIPYNIIRLIFDFSLIDRAIKSHPTDKNPITPEFQKRSEEHTSELQSRFDLVCRLLL